MEPFEIEDADSGGTTLVINESAYEGTAVVSVVGPDGYMTLAVNVTRAGLDGTVRALHEGAGLSEPLILPRPDLRIEAPGTEHRPIVRAGFKLWRDHRGVHLTEVFPSQEPYDPRKRWLDPVHARELAAVIAVLADRDEPDPAEVEELAGVIHEANGNTGHPGAGAWDLGAARAALRWMRERETGQ